MRGLKIFVILCILSGFCSGQSFQGINTGFWISSKIQFAPNNNQFAIAAGKKINIYQSGIRVKQLKNQNSKLKDVDFNIDGEKIVAVSQNGFITVWEGLNFPDVNFRGPADHVIGCKWLKSLNRFVLVTSGSIHIYSEKGELLKAANPDGFEIESMAVSNNGEFIAIASKSGFIEILNSNGSKMKTWDTDQDGISSMAFDPTTNFFASASRNNGIKLWQVDSWEFIKSYLDNGQKTNIVMFSNDSQYLAAGGNELILLPLDDKKTAVVFPNLQFDILDLSFSPGGTQLGVVADLSPKVFLYDISDLNIAPVYLFKDEEDLIAPQIYVSNPPRIINQRINFTRDIIDIRGSIFDDYGVRNLRINGIETPIRDNGKFIIHMPLAMGENEIKLEATDINGNISLKRFIINRRDNSETYDPKVAVNYLFGVGIDKYYDWPVLNNAVKDVNDLSSLLLNNYTFDFASITILKNEQATEQNILAGLRSLIEKITPQDNLIIYFSGHGYYDDLLNEGYWIPVDGKRNQFGSYLSNTEILKIIENIKSQHTFLIADACFSGSLFADSKRGGYIEKVEKFRSRWGLASGRLEVVSDGEVGINSPFARVLLEYLSEVEKDEFAVSELIQYVKIVVSDRTGQTPIGNPLRISGDEGGEFVFRKLLDDNK